MLHPLLELANAFITEDALVAKTANSILCKNLKWRRGEIGEIREIVKDTHPLRGEGRARLERVRREMSRQEDIRRPRASNKPIDWSLRQEHSKSFRIIECFKRFGRINDFGWNMTPVDFRNVRGSSIFLLRSLYRAEHALVIARPYPTCGPRQYITVCISRGHNIVGALMENFEPNLVKDALIHGRSIKFDFDRMVTLIELADGTTVEASWSEAVK